MLHLGHVDVIIAFMRAEKGAASPTEMAATRPRLRSGPRAAMTKKGVCLRI